ncbi:hypothetical protein [Deinococcus yavapaiensis]|uniref:Uncharacterized protein n=1 Tax=Deinococcus yavapaiensis KR-236 TaxID=694435 RepID=A0A318SH48_9DEIO|nr:hypothetical protein [Deinococcus yavapaiensis]PYE56435.1 hypothetical protein DES52_101239 [Deinococcus yavapaiensis KR-236]
MQPNRSSTRRANAVHFGFLSRPKLYGVFEDLESVLLLSERLLALGLGDEQVQVLEGEEGVRSLDVDGRHHGLVARLVRALQGMTDERMHVEAYVRHLLRGRYVVAVTFPRGIDHRVVCEAFKAAGGTCVNYYGALVVENLSA